ncbi:HlyD family type I secretion periplasmic adaptor subunit [Photobacterium aphoticum]|uniref:Membrane fusion protein (MFP) family protein n=1 Tax=Photobacterium aphoticum TaxID=754436 RepID=A0A0J1JB27_9GAMM|nr:HlyD family type I secretion periplasmic adaptor subunit [Photobacterium aphoticum]KLU98711.1 hemolysin secretion protein D [Photobacterium aphoticum]GHA51627.1 HlyD family type I secretion periplasmic adaptor subunit [Photobacterium aphoticum]
MPHNQLYSQTAAAVVMDVPKSARAMVWGAFAFVFVAIIWACFAQLDEVTVGIGKVIPADQVQVIQNLEGGIVKQILVKEGQLVEKGQSLLEIDDTLFRSDLVAGEGEIASLNASVIRLQHEIDSVQVKPLGKNAQWKKSVSVSLAPIQYSAVFVQEHATVVEGQRNEKKTRLAKLNNQLQTISHQVNEKQQSIKETESKIETLKRSVDLVRQELVMSKPLAEEGIVSRVDILKLERQLNDLRGQVSQLTLSVPKLEAERMGAINRYREAAFVFRNEAQAELNDLNEKLNTLMATSVGLQDRVKRTTVVSPVDGVVKTLNINTVGGVIQPGMELLEIVPSQDSLLIEANINPKDIAFIRHGLETIVKFTAYDFTIYGGLNGVVEHVSADTIQDEEGNEFYIVRVRTYTNELSSGDKQYKIIPGMLIQADIMTGKKTVMDYLLKPLLKAKQSALRER